MAFRKRSSKEPMVVIGSKVRAADKQTLQQAANALGISFSAYLERVVRREAAEVRQGRGMFPLLMREVVERLRTTEKRDETDRMKPVSELGLEKFLEFDISGDDG